MTTGIQILLQESERSSLRDLLERLAPSDGIHDRLYGGCVWCGHVEGHDERCPWVKARLILDVR